MWTYQKSSRVLLLCLVITAVLSDEGISLKLEIADFKLEKPTSGHSAVYDGQDSIYIIDTKANTSVVKYSISSGSIGYGGTFLNINAGVALPYKGDILYVGGTRHDLHSAPSPNVYRFITRNGTYQLLGSLPMPLREPAAALDEANDLLYTFGGHNGTWWQIGVYVFNLTDRSSSLVTQLPTYHPRIGRESAKAVWDSRRGVAHVFSGVEPWYAFGAMMGLKWTKQILLFNPAENLTVKAQDSTLPYTLEGGGAVTYVHRHDKVYIVGGAQDDQKLLMFDPFTGTPSTVEVQGWVPLRGAATVYVERLDRLYILGGEGKFNGTKMVTDQISYIDFGGGSGSGSDSGPQVTTSSTDPPTTTATTCPPCRSVDCEPIVTEAYEQPRQPSLMENCTPPQSSQSNGVLYGLLISCGVNVVALLVVVFLINKVRNERRRREAETAKL